MTDALSSDALQVLQELMDKAKVCNEKTEKSANVRLLVDDISVPVRIDDIPLLFIGASLLPNILNYLVNILPQFLYPYVVAYLQDFSSMSDDPVTINDLYDILKNGLDISVSAPASSETVGVQQVD